MLIVANARIYAARTERVGSAGALFLSDAVADYSQDLQWENYHIGIDVTDVSVVLYGRPRRR